jgi:ribulose-5-phosphate 4-epimerase/fuculose-1-phosphate aldolase
LLENHGILTVGTGILQAFDKIEVLENASGMTVIVEVMGNNKSLTKTRISEIERLFG